MTFTAFLAHRRVRVFLAVYCITLLAFTLSACGGGDPEPEPEACALPAPDVVRIGNHVVKVPRQPTCSSERQ